MVVVTYQVEKSVNHHAIQLLVEVHTIELGIILHAVYADEQISTEDILLAVVESNDVSKVIVLENYYKTNLELVLQDWKELFAKE